ncbi:MAG: MFS transporter [Alphaproteobacteria bacterium]|nr:MFS transporter [Alphaproteobacteria bacterium]
MQSGQVTGRLAVSCRYPALCRGPRQGESCAGRGAAPTNQGWAESYSQATPVNRKDADRRDKEGNRQDVSVISRAPVLAPFGVRSFRFQWPADLLASWAFEMEGVILGWFVLVSTGSVLALALFGSLQFLGTLISPVFGMAGDRIGNRNLLCIMRGTYVVVASVLAVLFLADVATPLAVFVLATVMGLVRPSDITMRNLLVGETMPTELLMRAMSVSRTTADSARIIGALSGAGLVAALGSGPAYLAVCAVYAMSLALTFNVGIRRLRVLGEEAVQASPLAALKAGFAYVWATPDVRAATILAFLMNFAAYPIISSLLPYVAKDIYGMDRAQPAGGEDSRGAHHARLRGDLVHAQSRLLVDTAAAVGDGAAVRVGLRAKLLHDPDGGAAVADHRSRLPRTGHGRAHACGLRHAPRHSSVGSAGRASRLLDHRLALQPGRRRRHAGHCASLQTIPLGSSCPRQHEIGWNSNLPSRVVSDWRGS